ncbi:hypothetical protein [Sphingobacterium wenxiniae]|uniref:Outer membrane protein beta-barrel domain-containing protein n=1 Tax=Sphingobacterium wenxiniae TaxID=683125 RepID=A0A1I6P9V0_9SPHI|nr:hypothetical protein [Sphingobacterium wenxiniae]SFS36910.1 hypothetical protein SAMN05660206_101352 [Sphingobacterium wenxiniae]
MRSLFILFVCGLLSHTVIAQEGWSSKYINLGFNSTKLKVEDFDESIKSKFGINLTSGRTFFFNKEPIADMLRFGLDWSWVDAHYSKFTDEDFDEEFSMQKLNLGMQAGPSVTVMPVDNLKIKAHLRYAPSYSLFYDADEELYTAFENYFIPGLTVSYGAVGLGLEYRGGSGKYDFSGEEEGGEKVKLKSSGMRFYVSFSF